MKRKIVLIVSLVAGLIAALLTRTYLTVKENEIQAAKQKLLDKYGTIDALALVKDTPSGTILTASDVGVLKVPAMGTRGQALERNDLQSIVGRKLLIGHKKHEVLFWSDIEGGNQVSVGLSADIKKAMRAVSINCSGAAAVSGMVKPNDHVDVIGTFDLTDPAKQSGAKAKALVTCTILQNVLVLATGSQTAKMRAFGTAGFSTVTLEVTPREAEMLAFAEQIKGRLVLTLRNRNDAHYERELPQVDFEKIKSEISELNEKRQQQKYSNR